jgi:hypothetical protein
MPEGHQTLHCHLDALQAVGGKRVLFLEAPMPDHLLQAREALHFEVDMRMPDHRLQAREVWRFDVDKVMPDPLLQLREGSCFDAEILMPDCLVQAQELELEAWDVRLFCS